MRKRLSQNIKSRITSEIKPRDTLGFIRKLPLVDYLDHIIITVYMYTRPKHGGETPAIYLTDLVCKIGHGVMRIAGLKKESRMAAQVGGFLLFSFEQLGMIELSTGFRGKHKAYTVEVIDEAAIVELWKTVPKTAGTTMPSLVPYVPYTSGYHETGQKLVKTGSLDVLRSLSPETHPVVFSCVNKSMTIGWKINSAVHNVANWALRNKTEAFSDIWSQQNKQAMTSKLREAQTVTSMADGLIGVTFYHMFYYDFRFRIYTTTAYLHHQGQDLAKGLLLRAEGKRIGAEGFFWLCVSIANNWAGNCGRLDLLKSDKIPLADRYEWVVDNKEIFISYAQNPKVNQGWMHADKCWQFLAACFEFAAVLNHSEPYEYVSNIECFIDGSTNGSQHLSALTRDEVTAPYVNLTPQTFPGDLYKYVADKAWETIDAILEDMGPVQIMQCNAFINQLTEIKKQISAAEPKTPERTTLIGKSRALKAAHEELVRPAAAVFWSQIKDPKERRKIVKRNVMTLPYGGSSYGLGEQQIQDAKKHGIEKLLYMEHAWGAWLGRLIFEDCRHSLARPMQLLSVFEKAGAKAEKEERFLSWKVPIVNTPVVQHYTEGTVHKVWVQWGKPRGPKLSTKQYENTLQLEVCFTEDLVMSKGKQSQGAAPNVIHSLDAAHLMLTVDRCDFPVTTIHDSYGGLAADMPDLFRTVRETFVQLYAENPLFSIMTQIGGDLSNIEVGTLDINDVLESEYAFA